ncbi:hypothetical protein EU803_13745 [Loktanella sp. IMCC34160]|uniref:hypothetical protein n=1 Tax=Loktanella sp. IMCC34160 TaxID=2510646 RepID=UPI00101DA196|nr:hypothetical protein [Loktanella sp. IMCC34160]RYG90288.1 hypothetical protein EU803_13745 [Loktanella sp. IMCC34160]
MRIPHRPAGETAGAAFQEAGIARSTAARDLLVLEQRKFLARDSYGDPVLGSEAWRVGYSAWGHGDAGPMAATIVRYLRVQTRRTAFLGVVTGKELTLLAFSLGRGNDYTAPDRNASYLLHRKIDTETRGAVHGMSSSASPAGFSIAPVAETSGVILVAGLLCRRDEAGIDPDRVVVLRDATRKLRIGLSGYGL